ncbi:glycoside hydrolase family 9 protein [Leeuwenhoekiella polynyae]|uniref:Cellulase-like Ig domain-containing protein n=1 Tax=Leeuwenhoekiella polynyae TaxID=1550906 RepID=A0A4Q0P4M8_9FLAO|nr:glycoside hydrolase family 9 protein [Leeuwenhoekiella polynyae]RXG20966.1 cellulase-like Ig domain-containing protein [Leeuwenhoekiella polynyae]
MTRIFIFFLFFFGLAQVSAQQLADSSTVFRINKQEYLERQGANVMLAHDFYPESHQGGVGVIQNGIRVATNGDLRLESTPGQWQPVPKVGERQVDRQKQEISVHMSYPDASKDRKGFNPIIYPGLEMEYKLKVNPQGKSFKITVDLDKPLPEEWIGKVGMNIEFFPGILFGKSYYMDEKFGLFNRQANGPGTYAEEGEYRLQSIAQGKHLVIAPGTPAQTIHIENLNSQAELQLLDGRASHSNGWFIVRSLVPAGKTKNAIEWLITPNTLKDFLYDPVVQISQVGYHPTQEKIAVIETDPNDTKKQDAKLLRINNEGGYTEVVSKKPELWGNFLRYTYYQLDFSAITKPGMYVVQYGDYTTEAFQITQEVYQRDVWQPTLEYFLPVQMCHMRVNDRYKVWHGLCHMDDARMAPIDYNHFDGYIQGSTTLTEYKSGEHVPELNKGGWHDAGDFDLRVESQAATVQGLAHIYENFNINYDNTSIDQSTRVVEILQPDGKPDILQQIEHGVLSIVGGYTAMGRFYRGIIVPTKRQYTLLGDPVNHSDNIIFSNTQADQNIPIGLAGAPDDRWVFTEENPARELSTAAALAAAARVLKSYNPDLAAQCLSIAKAIWDSHSEEAFIPKLELAVELLRSTQNKEYAQFLIKNTEGIISNIENTGWIVGPALPLIQEPAFKKRLNTAVKAYYQQVVDLGKKTPYGMPYEPDIWGAGWGIQNFGMKQYYFHTSYPEIFPKDYLLNALNFVLGAHPGVNTSSFASGVGARSLTQAYGMNRGEFSFIPGGIGSGTALIRPDFPELLEWPFLWQQTEYVLGGGTTDYIFLVLAADQLLNEQQ